MRLSAKACALPLSRCANSMTRPRPGFYQIAISYNIQLLLLKTHSDYRAWFAGLAGRKGRIRKEKVKFMIRFGLNM